MPTPLDPSLIDLPLPIRTPRLLLRPRQPGDGALTSLAVAETWDELHQWMEWADAPEHNSAEHQEIHTRRIMAKFLLREECPLLGIERTTGRPVVWCGFHSLDWSAHTCDTGYWVRRSAQNRGFATEATNALLRYAFQAMRMHRVGIAHAGGNERSRRVIEKLGFTPEGVQRSAAQLPGGHIADRHLYARLDLAGLPDLEVSWGSADGSPAMKRTAAELTLHLRSLEEVLLQPAVRQSPGAVSVLLTADFREIGSSGRLFTKAEILSLLATETPVAISLTDFTCDVLTESLALVTYRSHRHTHGGSVTGSARRSSLWREQNGSWQLYFHQGTRE